MVPLGGGGSLQAFGVGRDVAVGACRPSGSGGSGRSGRAPSRTSGWPRRRCAPASRRRAARPRSSSPSAARRRPSGRSRPFCLRRSARGWRSSSARRACPCAVVAKGNERTGPSGPGLLFSATPLALNLSPCALRLTRVRERAEQVVEGVVLHHHDDDVVERHRLRRPCRPVALGRAGCPAVHGSSPRPRSRRATATLPG